MDKCAYELKQDEGGFTGKWSSKAAHGEITLSANGEGKMTHSLLGNCRIKLTMANAENSFFKGDYSCTERHHEPIYASVRGTKKKSWW